MDVAEWQKRLEDNGTRNRGQVLKHKFFTKME